MSQVKLEHVGAASWRSYLLEQQSHSADQTFGFTRFGNRGVQVLELTHDNEHMNIMPAAEATETWTHHVHLALDNKFFRGHQIIPDLKSEYPICQRVQYKFMPLSKLQTFRQ